jgi:hypothetical protein
MHVLIAFAMLMVTVVSSQKLITSQLGFAFYMLDRTQVAIQVHSLSSWLCGKHQDNFPVTKHAYLRQWKKNSREWFPHQSTWEVNCVKDHGYDVLVSWVQCQQCARVSLHQSIRC